jgi:hypothetical protein
MPFLTPPCSLPQNLVSVPCHEVGKSLGLVCTLLIRLTFSAVSYVDLRSDREFIPVLRENAGGTRRQPGPCGGSTRTLTPRAARVSSRQVSSSTGTPFLMRSARVIRSGSPGISTGSSGFRGGEAVM